MISQKAKYAFKALVELGSVPRGQAMLIEEIATRANIPRKFLEHILLNLKHAGVISSRRGRGGGYVLLKDPAEITIGHVLRVIDGPIAPLGCLSRSAYRPCADCPDEEICAVRNIFGDIFAATIILMDATTLADAVRKSTRHDDDAATTPATILNDMLAN
ncbi:RrF2 family transcriptional regulator [Chthonobacter albigriseus]|uniref:RrF2 family transcriptional regulator n=1 Tax=Chthonobacter albigriseus TaxID=1683161 RepID=UPI0015EE6C69|nr:Rrf2 family transcriptional regulator [Chthonobacter albigriseus]